MLAAFKVMLPYFTDEEVSRFRTICISHQIPLNRALCSPKLDVLWFPFLKRLNKLDPTVSLNPPCSGNVGAWRYERFILGYEKISARQEKEISHIRENRQDLAKIYLDPLKLDGLSLLQQLEKRHGAIEKIRAVFEIVVEHDGTDTLALSQEPKLLLFQMPLIAQSPQEWRFPMSQEPEAIDWRAVEAFKKLKL